MITILERYIIKKILLAMLAVLGIAAALVLVVSFVGEMRQIGTGDYGLMQAALFSLLELPFNLSQFYPMLTLLGGLAGLGILASHQELVAMRAAGLSPAGLLKAVGLAAIVLALLGLVPSELLAPRLHYLADMRKTMDLSGGQAVATQSGLWVHEKDSFIHIDRVLTHRHLEGVTRYEFRDQHRLVAASHASELNFENRQWIARETVRTVFLPNGETESESHHESVWNVQLNPAVLNAGLIQPEEIPLTRLRAFSRHLEHSGMQVAEFRFSFSRRLLRPLAIMVMLFLAVPFVFVPPRTMSAGVRLFVGVLAGFLFYILNTLLGQLSVIFQLSPWLAALCPVFLFAVLDAWLIRRTFRNT